MTNTPKTPAQPASWGEHDIRLMTDHQIRAVLDARRDRSESEPSPPAQEPVSRTDASNDYEVSWIVSAQRDYERLKMALWERGIYEWDDTVSAVLALLPGKGKAEPPPAADPPATYHPTAVAVTLTELIREHLKHCLRTMRNVDCPDLLMIVDEWARKIAKADESGATREPGIEAGRGDLHEEATKLYVSLYSRAHQSPDMDECRRRRDADIKTLEEALSKGHAAEERIAELTLAWERAGKNPKECLGPETPCVSHLAYLEAIEAGRGERKLWFYGNGDCVGGPDHRAELRAEVRAAWEAALKYEALWAKEGLRATRAEQERDALRVQGCECHAPADGCDGCYNDCHVHGGGDKELFRRFPTSPYILRAEVERLQGELAGLREKATNMLTVSKRRHNYPSAQNDAAFERAWTDLESALAPQEGAEKG